MKLKMLFTSTLFSLGLIGAAHAEPAIIYDLGGKFDKSFNESAFNGAEKSSSGVAKSTASLTLTTLAQFTTFTAVW